VTMTEDRQREHPLGVPGVEEAPSARRAVNEMLEAGLLDDVMSQVNAGGLRLTGDGDFCQS
jgi:putative transposase